MRISLWSLAALAALAGLWLPRPAAGEAAPGPALPPQGVTSPLPPDRPITLAEAIQIALRQQPQLAVAVASTQAAAGRTRQAASALLPSLTLSSQRTRSGSEQTVLRAGTAASEMVTRTSNTASLSAQQLVFDFGRTRAQVAQVRNQQRSADQALAQTRDDVINQVKQAYYLLLQNEHLVGVQQSNLEAQRAHLALAQARFQAGAAPRADVLRAETAVANAQFSLTSAQNQAELSRVNLDLAMGVDPTTPVRVQEAEEAPAAAADLGALVELALRRRPEARRARFSVQAAQDALQVARVGSWPAVVTDAAYGLRGDAFPPSDRNWSWALSLQWPFFDAGRTGGRVQEAEANLRSVQASLRQTEQTVASEVAQALLNMQTAEQQQAAVQAEVASAQENLRVATGRYESGVGTYLEITDAQNALLTAQTNQVNVRYNLSAARAALGRALGLEEGT